MGCNSPGSSVHRIFPEKNTEVGCHPLLQEIFPTQRSNRGLLNCRQIFFFFLLSEPPEKPKDSLRPHNEQKYVLPNSGITTEGPPEVSRPIGLTQTALQNNTTNFAVGWGGWAVKYCKGEGVGIPVSIFILLFH